MRGLLQHAAVGDQRQEAGEQASLLETHVHSTFEPPLVVGVRVKIGSEPGQPVFRVVTVTTPAAMPMEVTYREVAGL